MSGEDKIIKGFKKDIKGKFEPLNEQEVLSLDEFFSKLCKVMLIYAKSEVKAGKKLTTKIKPGIKDITLILNDYHGELVAEFEYVKKGNKDKSNSEENSPIHIVVYEHGTFEIRNWTFDEADLYLDVFNFFYKEVKERTLNCKKLNQVNLVDVKK